MFYEPLSYPVKVVKKFDFITYSSADEWKVGQVFNYEPTNYVHIAWNEAKCFENIPNKDCKYKLLQDLGRDDIKIGNIVDFEQLPENRIDDWVLAGLIKKIYVKKENTKQKKVIKKSNKKRKVKKSSYSDISKKLELKPKQFKQKYSEIFNKEIENMKHTVSKPTEKKIIEAFSK